jgi:hypothetical protein
VLMMVRNESRKEGEGVGGCERSRTSGRSGNKQAQEMRDSGWRCSGNKTGRVTAQKGSHPFHRLGQQGQRMCGLA